jgi:hypothetical protein
MRVYRQLCNWQVRTYAHQEASVHDQVPQLLKAFGIQYCVTPQFSSTLAWLEESEIVLLAKQGPRFVHGNEFAAWVGLDGSQIDLYLSAPFDKKPQEIIANEAVAGRQHIPPILVNMPDLINVDDEWMANHEQFDLVLLDEALDERRQTHPPKARARFYSNWSYIEGIRAEELSRANWRAEISALRAEALNALAFALLDRPAESTDQLWKTILSTEHHDVYCFCAPELKSKSINWLQAVEQEAMRMAGDAAHAIISRIDCQNAAGTPVVVFNTTPHSQKTLVTVDVALDDPAIVDMHGEALASEFAPTEEGATRTQFLVDMQGLGYATYWVRSGGKRSVQEELEGILTFENDFYRASIQADGTFTSLVLLPSAAELLDTSTVFGNQLAAMDSTELGVRRPELAPRESWQLPKPGLQLQWKATAPARVNRSPLGVTLSAAGEIGSLVQANLMVRCYFQLPRIDLEWTFAFDSAAIGTFYDDDSKLRVHWPLAIQGDIYHDIAFGLLKTRKEMPFFPASWVDISNGEQGLAFFHQGTLKHWVTDDNMLVNLFAWGEHTEAIGSRMWRHNWLKAFDQRLRGTHTIRAALYPHAGNWRVANVIGEARSYGTPPVAYLADSHRGRLPEQLAIMNLSDPEIAATAVKFEDKQLICRLYSVKQENAPLEVAVQNLQLQGLRSIAGQPIDQLAPFQIAELLCTRQ